MGPRAQCCEGHGVPDPRWVPFLTGDWLRQRGLRRMRCMALKSGEDRSAKYILPRCLGRQKCLLFWKAHACWCPGAARQACCPGVEVLLALIPLYSYLLLLY